MWNHNMVSILMQCSTCQLRLGGGFSELYRCEFVYVLNKTRKWDLTILFIVMQVNIIGC